jgi:ArsR family transcriptional regulator, cadmium/lead-responsive transcriptional repressor
VGQVFAALSDPTRREMVRALLQEGSTSVPSMSARLPISRQAVAKHMAALAEAGLLERLAPAGREVRYRLRGQALAPASGWLREAETAWESRLQRLKRSFESSPDPGL